MLAEALESVRFIRGQPALVAIIAIGVFVDFAFVPLVVVLPVFAAEVLGGDGATYGYLLGVFFAGTLVGNLLVDWPGPASVLMGMGTVVVLAAVGGLFTPLVALGTVAPVASTAD